MDASAGSIRYPPRTRGQRLAGLEDRLIGGRYRIIRKIAEGGMGAVYEAKHHMSHKTVALKILFEHVAKDEAAKQRFLREVGAPAQIGHEGIVEIYDAGFDSQDGSPFVAMELLDGAPLRDRLAGGPVPTAQLIDWFEQILDPLAAAHDVGIVHRDLKPENIFLQRKKDGTEVMKILDFGIAREMDGQKQSVTHTGIAMGTPHYMAPEQAMSAKGVGPAADVWALGAMLYEALCGKTPFDGETASAIVVNACTKPHPPLSAVAPHVPDPLARLVDRCLAKEPSQRPQNAAQMLEELRRARGASAGMPPTSGAHDRGRVPQTAVLQTPQAGAFQTGPAAFGSAPGTHAPSYASSPGPHGGFGSAPGTPPPSYGSSPGYGSAPSYGAPPSQPGWGTASPGTMTAQPKRGGGGGLALGLVAAILLGGLLLVGGGIVVAVVLLSSDTEEEDGYAGSIGTVTVQSDVATGELIVDGSSRGTIVSGQQVRIEQGPHTLEIRERGVVVARGTVQVQAGQTTAVRLDRSSVPQPQTNVMQPGQTLTGTLQQGDQVRSGGEFVDVYQFDWPASGTVSIHLTSPSVDTYLIVVSPSGQQWTDDDGGGGLNSRLTLNLTEAGRWQVQASSFSTATGPYTLQITGP